MPMTRNKDHTAMRMAALWDKKTTKRITRPIDFERTVFFATARVR